MLTTAKSVIDLSCGLALTTMSNGIGPISVCHIKPATSRGLGEHVDRGVTEDQSLVWQDQARKLMTEADAKAAGYKEAQRNME